MLNPSKLQSSSFDTSITESVTKDLPFRPNEALISSAIFAIFDIFPIIFLSTPLPRFMSEVRKRIIGVELFLNFNNHVVKDQAAPRPHIRLI
ncbi:hypothetical protein P692DRAFT_20879600 [Suillus brevipes Sb2]|nr:hypothetical protein P692DRAFT_20879600 [Suillus brevipes Sb2]